MQRTFTPITQLAFCLLIALGTGARAADDKKVDPSGTWKWSFTAPNGQTRETTLKLKVEGENVKVKLKNLRPKQERVEGLHFLVKFNPDPKDAKEKAPMQVFPPKDSSRKPLS